MDAADRLRAKRREALAQLDTLLQSTFLDLFGDPVTNAFQCWEVKKEVIENDEELLTESGTERGRENGRRYLMARDFKRENTV